MTCEMSVEFTADSNSARQRETVTAPSLGAVNLLVYIALFWLLVHAGWDGTCNCKSSGKNIYSQ